MAFDFSTTSYVRVANNATIDNFTSGTVIMWLKGDGAGSQIFLKGLQWTALKALSWNAGNPDWNVNRATTDQRLRTNDTPMSSSGTLWQMLTLTFDDTNGAAIYVGDLDNVPVESAYALDDVGTGAWGNDDGGSNGLIVGNQDDLTIPAAGPPIAFFGYWNREMSLGEVKTQWQRRHVSSGCVVFWDMIHPSATTQVDWSGNGNNATAQSILADVANAPLPPAYGLGDGWLGNATAAAAATYVPYPQRGMRSGTLELAGGML